MGDRSNVKIINGTDKAIFLYSHWCGDSLLKTVHKALSRKQRWADESYLSRIVFCEMLRYGYRDNPLKAFDDECSFGISSYEPENEYKNITLDCEKEEITVGSLKSSFEEFVSAPEKMMKHYKGEQ